MNDEKDIVNEDETLDEEVETIDTEESEEFDTDTNDDEENDIEFEYDDDGNIIIPENTEDSDEEEEAEEAEEPEKTEEDPEKEEPKEDPKAKEEYNKLKEQYEYLLALGKDALAKLGVKESDVVKGLAELAAETDDKHPEEYLKEFNSKREADIAKEKLARLEFAERARKDLEIIHKEFPETHIYKDLREIPNIAKIAKYLDLGIPADEAYAAANSRAVREAGANSAKQKALNDNKSHLKSKVPVSSTDTSVKMSRSEIESYMEMFPDLSKKQIAELYGKVTKK